MRSYIGLSSCHRGYVPVGEEGVETGTPDLKEAFDTALDLPDDDPDHLAGNPMLGPNVWPDLHGFAEAVTDYYDAVLDLGHQLLWAFAVALGEDPDTLHQARHQDAEPAAPGALPVQPRRRGRARASARTPTTSASPCSSRPRPVSRCSTARASGSTCRRCPTPSSSTSATCSNCGPTAHTSRPATGSARSREERYSFPLFFNVDYHTEVKPLPQFVDRRRRIDGPRCARASTSSPRPHRRSPTCARGSSAASWCCRTARWRPTFGQQALQKRI